MRDNLKKARQNHGLTQRATAEILHISERMYKFIESGERIGSIELWDALEDLFGIHQRILRQNISEEDSL